MSGMKRKAADRKKRVRFTDDGVPRDAKEWTVEDWRILYTAIETAKERIAARHEASGLGEHEDDAGTLG